MQQHRRFSWLVSLGLAALFAVPHAAFRYRASIRLIVEFKITVHENELRPPLLQIFYDYGRGFREKASVKVTLPERTKRDIQAYLPVTRLRGLRIDWLNGPGRVEIEGFRIIEPFGEALVTQVPPERFTVFQTEPLQRAGDSLAVRSAAGADDPHIALRFAPALTAPREGKFHSSLVFGIKIFAIMAVALEGLFCCIGKSCLNDVFTRRRGTTA